MYAAVLKQIQKKIAEGLYQLTQHAITELNDDDFSVEDVEYGIFHGKIVERQKDVITGEWKYVIIGTSTQQNKKLELCAKKKTKSSSLLYFGRYKMICSNCERDTAYLETTTQAVKVFNKDEYILIQNIPVTKCTFCHEILFDAKVAKQLDEFRKNPDLAAEQRVKVAQFPQVA